MILYQIKDGKKEGEIVDFGYIRALQRPESSNDFQSGLHRAEKEGPARNRFS